MSNSALVMSAGREVLAVSKLIRGQFEAEGEVLADPRRRSELTADLETAAADAELARSAAGAWQQVFGDSFGDVAAEIDHDVRLRMRELTNATEASIDEMDPGHSWNEFEPWLYREVARSVGEHMTIRHDLLAACVTRVAEAFGDGDDGLVDAMVAPAPDATAITSSVSAHVDLEARKVGNQALTLLRNSYSGISMFGVLGHLAGLVVAPPVSVGLGLLLGGKSVHDEHTRQLAQRRAQAKASARRYLDDVSFLLGKDQRDTLRAVERSIRDHFSTRSEERYRTASAAYEAVYTASNARRGRARRPPGRGPGRTGAPHGVGAAGVAVRGLGRRECIVTSLIARVGALFASMQEATEGTSPGPRWTRSPTGRRAAAGGGAGKSKAGKSTLLTPSSARCWRRPIQRVHPGGHLVPGGAPPTGPVWSRSTEGRWLVPLGTGPTPGSKSTSAGRPAEEARRNRHRMVGSVLLSAMTLIQTCRASAAVGLSASGPCCSSPPG